MPKVAPGSKNICSLEEFQNAIKSGYISQLKKLNYLESYFFEKIENNDSYKSIKLSLLDYVIRQGFDDIANLLLAETSEPKKLIDSNCLYYAIEKDRTTIVKSLLAKQADPNIEVQGEMLIMKAIRKGHENIVKLLLEAGADPNLEDSNGYTPLYAAERSGNKKIIEVLCKALGDKITLHGAAIGKSEVLVKILSNKNNDPNAMDKFQRTPLYIAAEMGYESNIKLLLDAGANPNLECENGLSPLYKAAKHGHEKIVELLLKAGADPNLECEFNLETALYPAVENGHEKIVELLLKAGADHVKNTHISKLLNIAAGYEPIEYFNGYDFTVNLDKIVELLLKAGANPDLENVFGCTPLYLATSRGHEKIIELLIKAGANPNLESKSGSTPLHKAVIDGHEKIVELLLKAGASPNLESKNGSTALFIAATSGHVGMVKLLIKAGADLTFASNSEILLAMTKFVPNHITTRDISVESLFSGSAESESTLYPRFNKNRKQIVEVLLEAGANPNVNNNHATPLFKAVENGYKDIVKLLLAAKADPNYQNNLKETPLHKVTSVMLEYFSQNKSNTSHTKSYYADDYSDTLSFLNNDGVEIISLLWQSGANQDLKDTNRVTPLYLIACLLPHVGKAQYQNLMEIFEQMLKLSKNKEIQDSEGNTLFHWSAKNEYGDIIKLLIKHNVDPTVTNNKFETPDMLASSQTVINTIKNYIVTYKNSLENKVEEAPANNIVVTQKVDSSQAQNNELKNEVETLKQQVNELNQKLNNLQSLVINLLAQSSSNRNNSNSSAEELNRPNSKLTLF